MATNDDVVPGSEWWLPSPKRLLLVRVTANENGYVQLWVINPGKRQKRSRTMGVVTFLRKATPAS